MKILFVYPNIVDFASQLGLYHIGIGYLSSVLKKDGHSVSLFNIYKRIDKKTFIERVISEKPDLIAFSCTSHMFPFVKQFCNWFSEEGVRIQTVVGGVHATLAPQEVIETKGIDMVCVGEGEAAFGELCGNLQKGKDISRIKNMWVKAGDTIKKNLPGPLLENLDELPFPDRDIFNPQELVHESIGRLPIAASRGCPYNCAYCCNHALRDIYPNKERFLRFRSADNVISEIKEILARHPFYKSVLFHDDILFLNKTWARDFAALYKKEIGIPFSCNMRPEAVSDEIVTLLNRAGCFRICIGVESGNDYIRNQVLKRRTNTEEIYNAFKLCKSKGIELYAFNMVGIPFEKPGNVLETIKINSRISSDSFQVSIFFPYVGTELYNLCKKEKFISDRQVDDYLKDSCLNLPSISRSQILMFRRYFVLLEKVYSLFYRLPRVLSKASIAILDYLLTRRLMAYWFNVFYISVRGLYRKFLKNGPVQKIVKKIA